MPKRTPSALDALARHQQEQCLLAQKGKRIHESAALEIGMAVLEAGGADLGHAGIRAAIEAALSQKKASLGGKARERVDNGGPSDA